MPEIGAIAWLYAGVVIGMIVMAVVLVPVQYFRQKRQFRFAYSFTVKNKRRIPMQEITITNEQKVLFTLNPVTEAGKSTTTDGPPRLSVVSGEGTFLLADNGLSGELISSDNPGDTTYLLEADADLGTGVENIQETITVHTSHANAKSFGFSFGSVVQK